MFPLSFFFFVDAIESLLLTVDERLLSSIKSQTPSSMNYIVLYLSFRTKISSSNITLNFVEQLFSCGLSFPIEKIMALLDAPQQQSAMQFCFDNFLMQAKQSFETESEINLHSQVVMKTLCLLLAMEENSRLIEKIMLFYDSWVACILASNVSKNSLSVCHTLLSTLNSNKFQFPENALISASICAFSKDASIRDMPFFANAVFSKFISVSSRNEILSRVCSSLEAIILSSSINTLDFTKSECDEFFSELSSLYVSQKQDGFLHELVDNFLFSKMMSFLFILSITHSHDSGLSSLLKYWRNIGLNLLRSSFEMFSPSMIDILVNYVMEASIK